MPFICVWWSTDSHRTNGNPCRSLEWHDAGALNSNICLLSTETCWSPLIDIYCCKLRRVTHTHTHTHTSPGGYERYASSEQCKSLWYCRRNGRHTESCEVNDGNRRDIGLGWREDHVRAQDPCRQGRKPGTKCGGRPVQGVWGTEVPQKLKQFWISICIILT